MVCIWIRLLQGAMGYGMAVEEDRQEIEGTRTQTYLEEKKYRSSAVMNLPLFLIPSFRQLNSMKVRYIAYQD